MKVALLVFAVAVIVITAWYFLWYKPNHENDILDGTPCKSGGLPGKYKDNKCVVLTPQELDLPAGLQPGFH